MECAYTQNSVKSQGKVSERSAQSQHFTKVLIELRREAQVCIGVHFIKVIRSSGGIVSIRFQRGTQPSGEILS
jgi:hypothetical protein